MSWIAVPGDKSCGLVIDNYQEVGKYRIKLTVGECVRILQECEDWYYGYAGRNKSVLGIFPKSFIHIMDASFRDTTCGNFIYENQPHIVSEITSVLREWGVIWKKLYVNRNPNFKTIERRMYNLIKLRIKILSGTLPVDELKEVKRLVTWNIDVGNKLLGLDMVVRDDQGNILNPEKTSVIELFRHHETATKRIRASSAELNNTNYQMSPQSYNYTLFLSVRNLVCKTTDDIELLFTLYDQKQSKPFSENFVVRWTKDMFSSVPERLYNFRALFTDLGARDLAREKVYLVCYVIRNGLMELDQNNKSSTKNSNIDIRCTVRRPYAVAYFNLQPYFKEKESDEDELHFLPLLPCEKDTLESTLKRCFSLKDFPVKESKGQKITITFKLLQADLKQIREESPHLMIGNIATVRKMGFPEVILPGDVRNDLYLTLEYGEFSKGTKSSDKNIETVVTICSEKGVPLQGGIVLGGGIEPQSEYRSVVYYHDDKPRWYETLKVLVAIEEFKYCHLKFLFRHRSSKNETKEKMDKPFAIAFVRLMQENGTTLRDKSHELLVYKVDSKRYDSTDIGYLELACNRDELNNGYKISTPVFSLCNKDIFVIQTNVCSTKLTQNVDLLGLLNWSNEPHRISENLLALMKVEGEEVVKFLQDVLDTLFNILMLNSDPDLQDEMVFNCLLYVISLVLNQKYLHFQQVLNMYIEESFSATLAYNKLIVVLKHRIDHVTSSEKNQMMLMMKSLKYIMKFITRSRELYSQLYDKKGQGFFEESLIKLIESVAAMMRYETDNALLLVQAACLKHLPETIPDILKVFDCVKLSSLLMELINNLPSTRLTTQKLRTIDEIVHSPLFLKPECRTILLKKILVLLKQLLEVSDEIELCIKILGDIMDLLFRPESGDTTNDIKEVILVILRTIIQTTVKMDRESILVANLASVMISIYRQMTEYHFDIYIKHFKTRTDLLDFLLEILLIFKDLISRPVYATDWCEMILLQNNVILKSLKFFAHTIRDHFSVDFEHQVWNNFFHCAVTFLTQPALQLETFSQNKRWRILTRYKDMRRVAGFEIRNMWFNLGQYKKLFVPSLVSPFLEMTLIPEEELRKATIPIFFDMMQSEFYSGSNDGSPVKSNFSEFENEMIAKLDIMVEGGSGDEQYKNLFHSIMMNFCEKHAIMREQGCKFVSTVTRLMERLLEYRCIINDENKENRMICTVNLLDFYNEINRKEMFIRYVNKLCALHLECDNYTEAAYTLRLHSKLLNWSDTPLPPILRSMKYLDCKTHRQLKEALYQDMIAYFDKGKMWECAIRVCKELMRHFEEETMDYTQLSALHCRMSQFYDYIIHQQRHKPTYFRVAYYGKGFPSFLSNKVFIHRGKEYDRLDDFRNRMMDQHMNAELMSKLSPPSDELTESSGQYMQINHVEPIMDEEKQLLLNKSVNEQILHYYKVNDVQTFQYSRRVENESGDKNEFANLWLERTVLKISSPLPGILKWFPVVYTKTYLISPLKIAIEKMQNTNKELKELIIAYENNKDLKLNSLELKLKGIIDAEVMGGITNYEKAFFNSLYLEEHPEDADLIRELKDLIASQIPLLDEGIRIYGQRVPHALVPLRKHLEKKFAEMKFNVEEKYGKKTSDIKSELVKYRRRTTTGHSFSSYPCYNLDDRLSQTSISSTEGRSMRSFVPLPSPFSSTPTLTRGHNQSKSLLMPTNSLSSSIAVLAAPVLSGCSGSPTKFSTFSSFTRKEKKEKKRRHRTGSKVSIDTDSISSKDSNICCTVGNTQWYTPSSFEMDSVSVSSHSSIANGTVFVQDLESDTKDVYSAKSDSEKEKVSSRPSSDSSFNLSDQMSILSNINRDSFGTTTDSATTSEDDRIPPPLPAKHRELDTSVNCLNNDTTDSPCSNSPRNSYITYTLPPQPVNDKFRRTSELLISTDQPEEQLPTPPPKKPINRFSHTTV